MAKRKITYERNQMGIVIKRCCASCAHKSYQNNARRTCTKRNMTVKATNCCGQWQMSEGLSACGRHCGVVRDKDTKEVVIH